VGKRHTSHLSQKTRKDGAPGQRIEADSVYGGAGYDYECAGVEEGVGGSGEQCGDAGYGAYAEAAPNLKVESGAGSPVVYVTFNVTYPLLKDKRVRQAVACAIDRQAIVDAIMGWAGSASGYLLANGALGSGTDDELAHYSHNVIGASGCWRRRASLPGEMACGCG